MVNILCHAAEGGRKILSQAILMKSQMSSSYFFQEQTQRKSSRSPTVPSVCLQMMWEQAASVADSLKKENKKQKTSTIEGSKQVVWTIKVDLYDYRPSMNCLGSDGL